VVFSSIAGRFGNGGQTDYSAANDLLCKSVSGFRSSRPGTKGIAIDWTAWAGIGMASRGSIPKMMALAGIDMLPAEVGVPVVRRELTAAGAGTELVVAGSLGLMLDERHATGGLDPESAPAPGAADGPLAGRLASAGLAEGVRFAVTLDPTQPFLDHHRIDGTPVLPGVMGIEAFVEAARRLAPGLPVTAVEDVAFLAPVKCYRDEPRTVEVVARLEPDGDRVLARCHLEGRRTLPGQPEQVTRHFEGTVVLGGPATTASGSAPPVADRPPVGPDAIYRIYFHGPAYQVLASAWGADGTAAGELAADLADDRLPADAPLFATPRLVELCFQTAGVQELATTGRMALPARVARIEWPATPPEGTRLVAVVQPGTGGTDAEVVTPDGDVVVRLRGYTTTPLPVAAPDDDLRPLRDALG
jgi:hypothetical protein